MSDDPNEKELPEDDEEKSGVEESESTAEATEIDLEPVGADEGIGGGGSDLLGKGKLSEKDDRTFGMLAHLLGAITSFVGPLVIYLIKKEESPFVEDQGKEALNFQITIAIGILASVVLTMVPFVGCFTFFVGPAIGVVGLIFSIIACLKANEGEAYRYPFALRLIK